MLLLVFGVSGDDDGVGSPELYKFWLSAAFVLSVMRGLLATWQRLPGQLRRLIEVEVQAQLRALGLAKILDKALTSKGRTPSVSASQEGALGFDEIYAPYLDGAVPGGSTAGLSARQSVRLERTALEARLYTARLRRLQIAREHEERESLRAPDVTLQAEGETIERTEQTHTQEEAPQAGPYAVRSNNP